MSISWVQLAGSLNGFKPSLGSSLLLAMIPNQWGGPGQSGPRGQRGATYNYWEQIIDLKKVPAEPVAACHSSSILPHVALLRLSTGLQFPSKRPGETPLSATPLCYQLAKAGNGPQAYSAAQVQDAGCLGWPLCLVSGRCPWWPNFEEHHPWCIPGDGSP